MYLDDFKIDIIKATINFLDEIEAPLGLIEGLQSTFTDTIDLLIPGHPIGKERPRLSNGVIYTPQKTKDFENLIKLVANPKFKQPLTGKLGIDIEIWAFGRVSDIDNIAKAVLDGLQGIAFNNDNQIIELNIKLNKVENKAKEKTIIKLYQIQEQINIASKRRLSKTLIKDVVNAYHRLLPELPKVKAIASLKEKLKARINEDIEREKIEFWESYFILVRECPFLMGEQTDWHANLDWLLGKRNMSKVLNGLYLPSKNGKNKIHNSNKNVFEKLEKEGFNL